MGIKLTRSGLWHTSFSVSFPNSLAVVQISFQTFIEIFFTWSSSAGGFYFQTEDSKLNWSDLITTSGGATGAELVDYVSPVILFGGANQFNQFVPAPITTRAIRIRTTLGGGASGTVGFFFKPIF